MKGFRDFLLKGNLVTMAVGLVMALAFEAMVLAFVEAFITPAIGLAAGGHANFAASGFHVRGVLFPDGLFITALISFVIIAAIVYFAIVIPFTHLMARFGMGPAPTKPCPECLSTIPAAATRCAFCTAPQPAPAATP